MWVQVDNVVLTPSDDHDHIGVLHAIWVPGELVRVQAILVIAEEERKLL